MFYYTPFRHKDFIVSDIAYGFDHVKDMSFLSAEFTNYRKAENPTVKPALHRLLQNDFQAVP